MYKTRLLERDLARTSRQVLVLVEQVQGARVQLGTRCAGGVGTLGVVVLGLCSGVWFERASRAVKSPSSALRRMVQKGFASIAAVLKGAVVAALLAKLQPVPSVRP